MSNLPSHQDLIMAIDKARLRQLHAALAPFMTFSLLLILLTGMSFQMAVMSDKGDEFFGCSNCIEGNLAILI